MSALHRDRATRPIILCFVAYYLPGYRAGGPLRTISNFVDRLGDEFDIRIVTGDRDVADTEPYAGVRVDRWNQVGKAQVFYASERQLTLAGIARLLRDTPHDILYLNSFFTFQFTCLPLVARRLGFGPETLCVIAPRGEFSAGALTFKAAKKRLYLAFTRFIRLYEGLRWQASSKHERSDILKALPWLNPSEINIAMNLASTNNSDSGLLQLQLRSREIPLRVCFFSRIAPKKNLDFALRVLSSVRSDIVFTIYGPKEDATYWQCCEALIEDLPVNIVVRVRSEIHPSNVNATLAEQDLFFLPTRGENYGHVIHEALNAGLLVLISDQTPWLELEERGLGWALPLDDESRFAEKIEDVACWSNERYQQARLRSRAYAADLALSPSSLEDNRALFFFDK